MSPKPMSDEGMKFKKQMRKGRWIMWMRIWWGSIAFAVGIMCLVVGGLFMEAFNISIWFVTGLIGALLIGLGFYLISTC